MKLSRIDESNRNDHYFLKEDDECFFFGEYTANKGYSFSETNQLILNLKKTLDASAAELQYKQKAIKTCARMLSGLKPLNGKTFIPIPPSKSRSDPLYDDRLTKVLMKAALLTKEELHFLDCIEQSESIDAFHKDSKKRLRPDELKNYYSINQHKDARKQIVIFDDVLTTGSHFKAAQGVLKEQFPDRRIIGLFLARRSINFEDDFADIEDSQMP